MSEPNTHYREDPKRLAHAFTAALADGDPQVAMTCISADAGIITPDGTKVSSRDGIASVVGQITASTLTLKFEPERTVAVGDIALSSHRLHLISPSDPQQYAGEFGSVLVMSRVGGLWGIVIAALWD
jgi:ketosteroid isomerase-like protein